MASSEGNSCGRDSEFDFGRDGTDEEDSCPNRKVREMVNRSFSQVGRHHRSGTQQPGLPAEEDSGDSDSELTAREVEEKIIYIRNVSRSASVKRDNRWKIKPRSTSHLFDYIMVVKLQDSKKSSGFEPYVSLRFPSQGSSNGIINVVPQLCFPDAAFWIPSASGQFYSIVLTSEVGNRSYGYCKRIRPADSLVCLPIVYCIISPVRASAFYSNILDECERKHGSSEADMLTFLEMLYSQHMPNPGGYALISSDYGEVELLRPEDSTVVNPGIVQLTSSLDSSNLMKVFAAILMERQVLLFSSDLSQLSYAIQGLQDLLFPFEWQHTLIPILPCGLLEVVCSPSPYIIGVLGRFAPHLHNLPLDEHVLIVDLDQNKLLREIGDEVKVIPKRLNKALSTSLKLAKSVNDSADVSSSLLVSEAFLRMFLEVVSNYSKYIVTQQDGTKVFQKELFCKECESRSISIFLQWFTETAMFHIFIESKLNSTGKGVFDRRIQEYQLQMEINAQSFRGNVKELGKKVKTFGEKFIGFKSPQKVQN